MWRLGLAGAGAFGRFLLTALAPLPDVTLAAVAARTPARRAAAALLWRQCRAVAGLPAGAVAEFDDAAALARSPDLDVVLVAVPPDLQPAVARAAVARGRAVFLEKPGALTPAALAAVAAAAGRRGVPAALDLVMRANPLMAAIRALYRAGWLGPPERWHVEDWAGDAMADGHWFWDPARSGGVRVEHGVHFFDEVAWVLDARPQRAWGRHWPHPGTAAPARALAVVEYAGGGDAAPWHLVASFYHGFVRPAEQEHQVRELGFARGWIRVYGWIPTVLEGEVDLPAAARSALAADPLLRLTAGEGGRVRLTARLPDREAAYREMVRTGLRSLLAALAASRWRPWRRRPAEVPLQPRCNCAVVAGTLRGRRGGKRPLGRAAGVPGCARRRQRFLPPVAATGGPAGLPTHTERRGGRHKGRPWAARQRRRPDPAAAGRFLL